MLPAVDPHLRVRPVLPPFNGDEVEHFEGWSRRRVIQLGGVAAVAGVAMAALSSVAAAASPTSTTVGGPSGLALSYLVVAGGAGGVFNEFGDPAENPGSPRGNSVLGRSPATTALGGGGGGVWSTNNGGAGGGGRGDNGGNGGSGVVIVAYSSADPSGLSASGGNSSTSSGGMTYLVFTSDGTLTVS